MLARTALCTALASLIALFGVAEVTSCVARTPGQTDYSYVPPVELTRGLPNETRKISPAFDQRIQAKFPIGSSERTMVDELIKQGFARQAHIAPDSENGMLRIEYGMPCRSDYRVYWRSNAQGRLTSISGEADVTCL
jgi:hypothetical protein